MILIMQASPERLLSGDLSAFAGLQMSPALLRSSAHERTFSASGTLFAWRATALDPPTGALPAPGPLQDSHCYQTCSACILQLSGPHTPAFSHCIC